MYFLYKNFFISGSLKWFWWCGDKKIYLKYIDCVNLGEKGWLCILMSLLYVWECLDFYDWIYYFILVWFFIYFFKVYFGCIMVLNSFLKKILLFIYNLFCKKLNVIRFYIGWNCFKMKIIFLKSLFFDL